MVATTEPLQMVHEYIVPGERNHRLEIKLNGNYYNHSSKTIYKNNNKSSSFLIKKERKHDK